MLNLKYNGIIYSGQVPDKIKTDKNTSFFTYKHIEKWFFNHPSFDAFCGTNKYPAVIYF